LEAQTTRHLAKQLVAMSFVMLATACTGSDSSVGAALASATSEASGPPTGSPGRAVSVTSGRADVTVVGDVRDARVYAQLTTPAVYAPEAGGITLAWRSDRFEVLTISGTVTSGAQPTSSALSVQFMMQQGSKLIAFSSSDGECGVTVETLEETSFRGSFDCAELTSIDGDRTVQAAGSFEASA
jgi:hypothetical protein